MSDRPEPYRLLRRASLSTALVCACLVAHAGCEGRNDATAQPPPPTWQEKLATRTDALAGDPDNADLMHSVAFAHLMLGNSEEAARHWENAVARRPDFWKARFNLANAHHRLGKLDEALAGWHAVADSTDDAAVGLHAKSCYNIGAVLDAGGEFKESISFYERAIKLDPEHYDAHVGCGAAWYELQQDKKAAQLFRRAIELRPDGWRANFNLGLIEAENENLDEAVGLLLVAAEGMGARRREPPDSKRSEIYTVLAECEDIRRNYVQAYNHISNALQYDPDNVLIQNRCMQLSRKAQRVR